jgi:prolyl-tRNA editing enzyme YbaK/EbsC (Cys-tRNA(Pro) deacylase)
MANDAFAQSIRQHPAVARVRDALAEAGVDAEIIVMPEATHTAQAAADALRCSVAEIAKSIIFRSASDRTVLVITSGANRVDEKKVVALIDEKVGKADADFVRDKTGFVIGGVAPLAHIDAPIVLLDQDLLAFRHVYPAAGHPNTMFRIEAEALVRITAARVADVALAKK